MKVKLTSVKGLSAIPTARTSVTWAIDDNGIGQVMLTISAVRSDVEYVVTSLRMSLTEANDLHSQIGRQSDLLFAALGGK